MDSRQSHITITYSQLISIAAPVALTALLGNIMGSANSVLIPQELVRGGMNASESISAFGVLCGMTMSMLNLPTGLIGALGLTMVPGLARQAALGQWKTIRTTLGRVIRLVSLLMAPALALLTVIGPDIGKVLFANPNVGEFMFPLAVGTLLSCWQSVLSGALNGIGRQRSAAVNAIICDAVQLAFTVLTVSKWGLSGFVTGFVVSSLLGAALNLWSMCRFAKLRPAWFQWFLCPALAAVLAGLCSNLLFRWLMQNGASQWTGCAAVCVVGGIVYLAALQAQGGLGGHGES